MRFEKVHTVRDYFDGVRSGTADLDRAPHYFSCVFDEAADGYSNRYRLYPVSPLFMERELEHWSIFRKWEHNFHRGLASVESHPGHGGIDVRYDELRDWIDQQIRVLQPLPVQYEATFRAIPGQDDLPPGVLRELEVGWTPLSA